MHEQQVIKAASVEWTAPIVIVPEKDGTVRICIDCKNPNALK